MTVDDYIDSLSEDRRIAIRAVREAVNSKLPPGYEEGIVYGMIAWFVPFTRLAETYNGQPLCVASLGSQKSHMALYMMSVYGDEQLKAWFEKAYKASGKNLNMGKSCVRFKKVDELALDVIAEAIARVPVDTYVAHYEAVRANTAAGKQAEASAAAAKAKAAAIAAAAKAKATATEVVGKAKAAAGKAKAAAGKAKAAAGKAKAAIVKAEGKAKAAAGKAKAAIVKAEGKAKTAIVKAEGKAKTAIAKAKATAQAKVKSKKPAKRASK